MTLLSSFVGTKVAAALGWTIFHSLWQGAAIALLLALALSMTRAAGARYAAACVSLAAMTTAFAVTFLHLFPNEAVVTIRTIAGISHPGATGGDIRGLPLVARASALLPWVAPLWIAGVFLFAMRGVASWVLVERLRTRGLMAVPDGWQKTVTELASRLRLSRPVTVFQSCLAEAPVVLGHLRPVILIPVGMLTGLAADQVEAIFLHELAHVARRDYLVNLVATCAESLLFYHPAVWWISRVMRTEREHCCDDMVIRNGCNARRYAGALTALEEFRGSVPEPAMAATGGLLMKRIERLLNRPEGPRISAAPVISAAILIAVAAIVLVAKPQNQPGSGEPAVAYAKWVQEDVAYIITDAERAEYRNLTTDAEREEFVRQFWLRRDPTQGTPENEFKEEHYRRIAFANGHFSEGLSIAGWKTDRGRIYIVYGPPDEIDSHPRSGPAFAYPYEEWRYRRIEGIAENVLIQFVDPARNGEFHMTMDPNPSSAIKQVQ